VAEASSLRAAAGSRCHFGPQHGAKTTHQKSARRAISSTNSIGTPAIGTFPQASKVQVISVTSPLVRTATPKPDLFDQIVATGWGCPHKQRFSGNHFFFLAGFSSGDLAGRASMPAGLLFALFTFAFLALCLDLDFRDDFDFDGSLGAGDWNNSFPMVRRPPVSRVTSSQLSPCLIAGTKAFKQVQRPGALVIQRQAGQT